MSCITKDKIITIGSSSWLINSSGSGLIVHSLKAIINQVNVILTHHSRVHLIRFDLRLYHYTDDNKIIVTFNKRLHKWLKRKYQVDKVGFAWCREQEKSEQQHYHYVVMINGHKVRHPHEILKKATEIWNEHLGGSLYTPKNCYYNLKRNDFDSIQPAIYRISYLAKAKGKGKKPAQTKNYGTSRMKSKVT